MTRGPFATPAHALVWGAQGFIGRELVSRLLADGFGVRVLSRGRLDAALWAGERIEWFEYRDSSRERTFRQALDGSPLVFNLAGSSGAVASNRDPLESLESNCRIQLEFLRACAASSHRPHVVLASSRLVYSPSGQRAVDELHPVEPLSMYGVHKLAVEGYHRIFATQGQITFTACRISNPYGVDESASMKGYGFINALIQHAMAGEPLVLFGDGAQRRDYLHIDDLVSALRLCGAHPDARNEIFNIGCGQSIPIRDAAIEICRVFSSGRIELRSWPSDFESVEAGDFVMNIAKARARLGFEPRFSFQTGLQAVLERCAAPRRSVNVTSTGAKVGTAIG